MRHNRHVAIMMQSLQKAFVHLTESFIEKGHSIISLYVVENEPMIHWTKNTPDTVRFALIIQR